ncbi:aminotransferase [Terasakiispira papahanaumokuakeensis]|uniref:Aminotransferase n=1 Tax=Terasakiispira papahanaumokuakeensis TaxID=197479 RepID=A0A1E2VCH8_9GAMM|nr:pyridoxal phosphate-dependent aminotransferase [Terasakiispira papahanaumokuakeensis]ODC04681.1 aminotransferase [Terasakiispira papahanaumokuakeensis]
MDYADFSVASRLAHIRPFEVMRLLARAQALQAQGRDILHLEVGEPDFPSPPAVIEAGQAALAAGQTRYTPACGIPELREAIAAHYQRMHGVSVDPARIVVTPGASGALLLAAALIVNPGDGVLMADPTYPCNAHFMALFDADIHRLAVGPETRFQLTAELARANWRAHDRLLMLASPANPTGTVVTLPELAQMAEFAREQKAALLVDEIYQGLVYDGASHTALEVADDALVINSFSKYFGMTGWRLGWLVAPEAHIEAVERLAQNIFLAASTPAQYAALAAFSPETQPLLEARRLAFAERRDFLLRELPKLGLKTPVIPEGAFYIYCDVSALTEDSFTWCEELLEATGVALTPGRDFGQTDAERWIRIAYTCDVPRLAEGLARIARFIEQRRML